MREKKAQNVEFIDTVQDGCVIVINESGEISSRVKTLSKAAVNRWVYSDDIEPFTNNAASLAMREQPAESNVSFREFSLRTYSLFDIRYPNDPEKSMPYKCFENEMYKAKARLTKKE